MEEEEGLGILRSEIRGEEGEEVVLAAAAVAVEIEVEGLSGEGGVEEELEEELEEKRRERLAMESRGHDALNGEDSDERRGEEVGAGERPGSRTENERPTIRFSDTLEIRGKVLARAARRSGCKIPAAADMAQGKLNRDNKYLNL